MFYIFILKIQLIYNITLRKKNNIIYKIKKIMIKKLRNIFKKMIKKNSF